MVEYEKLEYLRHHTYLNLIDKIKIKRLKESAEKYQRLINTLEHCDLGVDYKEADEYEFNKRFNLWMQSLFPLWSKYNDGLDLYEFSLIALDENCRKEKEENDGNSKQRIK